MPQKPTIFVVVDVETTKRDGLVFDIGWNAIDRKGKVYSQGSYLAYDVLQRDMPFYLEKIGLYYKRIANKTIRPLRFRTIRKKFNAEIIRLHNLGHRIIFCAYNAPFDASRLGDTSRKLTGSGFLQIPIHMLDIWHAWCETCPRNFTSTPSKSGKFWSTSAESVYAWEMQLDYYVEPHIAFPDTLIESEILMRVLARKKKLPIVSKPDQFTGNPWKIANNRVRKLPGQFIRGAEAH
jgi:hypothetical protein